jgi:hypothetical protein
VLAQAWPSDPYRGNPPRGHFVYILWDADGACCYVGETKSLRSRLIQHGRNKAFTSWTAYRMRDRAQAQSFEAAAFERLRPYLFSDGSRRCA